MILRTLIVFCIGILFLMSSCATPIYLNKTPSESMLVSIKPSPDKKAKYEFLSQLPDQFKYRHKKLLDFEDTIVDLNQAYRTNLDAYMNTKYSLSDNYTYLIKIELVDCKIENKDTASTFQKVDRAIVGAKSRNLNWLLNTEIKLKVTVSKNGKNFIEKTITSIDEHQSTGRASDLGGGLGSGTSSFAVKEALDRAIGKSIVMMDKFLVSNGL